MAPRKKVVDGDSTAVVPTSASQPAPLPSSKLPPVMRFPLYCTISLSLAALLHTFVTDVTGYELHTVSRSFDDNWRIAATVISRVLELAVGWYGNYDGTSNCNHRLTFQNANCLTKTWILPPSPS